ncbi:glycosyltransferase [uncultured Bacteroides sp.]|uniref:glycosyltransferase n=1 Tax=uncultured Bacteroides sp. TaxID=162156 RepID=UPI0025920C89|nr:glycosyltransferase [uncultured Bacteroides sp.]
MKTKIVYSVVSNEKDIYLEQTLVSIYSLLLHNQGATIILVIDKETDSSIKGKRKEILKYVSEKVVIDVPNKYSKKQRSRYIKTSLRQYINGDYLFIDSDTIITSSLAEIDGFTASIAAVKDRHFDINNHRCLNDIRRYASIINWKMSDHDRAYFNSGVFYVKDNDETHAFYECWHKYWMEGCEKGVDVDQPSLGKTNSYYNLIKELDGIWNCQILVNGLPFLYNAKILHYFSTNLKKENSFPFFFSNKRIFFDIKEKGELSEQLVNRIKNAKSEFSINSEIVGGEMLNFQYTNTGIFFRGLYLNCKPLFNLIEIVNTLLLKIVFLLKRK